MPRSYAVVLSALLAFPALAVEVAGVNLKESATVGGHALVMNGAGIRSRMIVGKVYVASLYLHAKASNLDGVLAESPRRIQLDMLRTVSADTFADALSEGLQSNNTAAEMTATEAGRVQLMSIIKRFSSSKKGDVVTLDFVDGGTTVTLNGVVQGVVPGDAFNRALLKVWLGKKPMQRDLKSHLLGG